METSCRVSCRRANSAGEQAFVEREGPLHLIADWVEPVFLHYRIDPVLLQTKVPYELDLFAGQAWVSLVAFTMKDMRLAMGGRLSRWLFAPFREQRFLNVRTYVKHDREFGIHFIAEWISDWISSQLGPGLYGLPYRHGQLDYSRTGDAVDGVVLRDDGRFLFRGWAKGARGVCEEDLEVFLLERYVAFNAAKGKRRYFRVWHEPWMRQQATVETMDDSLLRKNFSWWPNTEFDSAHMSDGTFDVRMSRPKPAPPIPPPMRPTGVSVT